MEPSSVMIPGSSRERRCGRIGAAEDTGGGAGGHVAAVGSRPRARECGVWTTLEDLKMDSELDRRPTQLYRHN